MSKRIAIVAFILVMAASAAWAQIDPDPDGIGIYADMGGMINTVNQDSGLLELHVLLTNTTSEDQVPGWELRVDFNGPLSYLGHLIPYNHINVGYFPDFIVGNAQAPRPAASIVHLVSLSFMVTGGGPGEVFIRNCSIPPGGSLGNDLPVYVSGGSPYGDLRSMYPSSGSTAVPVFRINAEAPVAVVRENWGNIKALFR